MYVKLKCSSKIFSIRELAYLVRALLLACNIFLRGQHYLLTSDSKHLGLVLMIYLKIDQGSQQYFVLVLMLVCTIHQLLLVCLLHLGTNDNRYYNMALIYRLYWYIHLHFQSQLFSSYVTCCFIFLDIRRNGWWRRRSG